MTMHMTHAALSTTKTNSKGKKLANTARLRTAKTNHDDWLKSKGLHPDQVAARKKNIKKQKASFDHVDQSMLSNNLHVRGGFRTGIMEQLRHETPEIQEKIIEKANRTAPAYSKGPYQFISPGTDLTDIGKKK